MMMAHSHLSDRRYAGDRLIRHYRPLGLAAYHADHGTSGDSVTITGGIGTLTMYADGREDWKPTLPGQPIHADPKAVVLGPGTPAPIPAAADLAEARRAVCQACEAWRDSRCSVAGCSCAGMGIPGHQHSRCPRGLWP